MQFMPSRYRSGLAKAGVCEMRNTVRERTGISVELAEVTGREDAFGTCEAELTSGIKEQAHSSIDAMKKPG